MIDRIAVVNVNILVTCIYVVFFFFRRLVVVNLEKNEEVNKVMDAFALLVLIVWFGFLFYKIYPYLIFKNWNKL